MSWIWSVIVVLASSAASAQGTPQKPPLPCKKTVKLPCEQIIDISDPLKVNGRLRTLSLLGFLERASEELERAALEKKSFVPKLIHTIDEEPL